MTTAARNRRRPRPQPGRSHHTGWLFIGVASAVVVALAGALIVLTLRNAGREPASAADNALSAALADAAAELPAIPSDGLALGDPGAPLTLEIFADFQCPYCVAFSGSVEPALIRDYVATGKLHLVFRNFPFLGTESLTAAQGAICAADQGRGWPYILEAYRQQAAAGQTTHEQIDAGRFSAANLDELAGSLGLDRTAFRSCLADPATTAAVQQQYREDAALGVRGTPSFALNGTLIASPPQDVVGWRALLESALAEA
jgi:protein-disulfide isomerase